MCMREFPITTDWEVVLSMCAREIQCIAWCIQRQGKSHDCFPIPFWTRAYRRLRLPKNCERNSAPTSPSSVHLPSWMCVCRSTNDLIALTAHVCNGVLSPYGQVISCRSTVGTPEKYGIAVFRLAKALFSAGGANTVYPSQLFLLILKLNRARSVSSLLLTDQFSHVLDLSDTYFLAAQTHVRLNSKSPPLKPVLQCSRHIFGHVTHTVTDTIATELNSRRSRGMIPRMHQTSSSA